MSKKSYNPRPKTKAKIRTYLFQIKSNANDGYRRNLSEISDDIGVSHTVATVMRDMRLIEDVKFPKGSKMKRAYNIRYSHIDENLVSLVHLRLGQYNRDKALYKKEKEKPDFIPEIKKKIETKQEVQKLIDKLPEASPTREPSLFPSLFDNPQPAPTSKQLFVMKVEGVSAFIEVDWNNRKVFRFKEATVIS